MLSTQKHFLSVQLAGVVDDLLEARLLDVKKHNLLCREGRILIWRWHSCQQPILGMAVFAGDLSAPVPLACAAFSLCHRLKNMPQAPRCTKAGVSSRANHVPMPVQCDGRSKLCRAGGFGISCWNTGRGDV